MKKKKKNKLPKGLVDLEFEVPELHVSISGLTGAQTRAAVHPRKDYKVGTCVACYTQYAYTGENPQYCPKCFGGKNVRGQGKPIGGVKPDKVYY